MKMNSRFLLPLLVALVLSGCVTSKTPVGDQTPQLDPKVWNGKWRDGSGRAMRTHIKDAKLGLVEVTNLEPWTKPSPGNVTREDVLIRTLGGTETIANTKQGDGYGFARVYNDGASFLVFSANVGVFQDLIRRGKLSGSVHKDHSGKSTGSCTIDHLNDRDYKRLQRQGFDVQMLFDENPSTVMTRSRGLW